MPTGAPASDTGLTRVLLVEDNRHDAELMFETLMAMGGFRVEVAASIAEGVRHVEEKGADVVLLDLTLPDAFGVSAVSMLCGAFPELAVVVLTGIADDEMGLRAVLEGAQDYLIKGRVDGALVARAVRHAVERKRSEERLRFQAQILESAGEGLMAVDPEGRIVFWNRAAERIHGSSAEEVRGLDFRDVMLEPQVRERADQVIARLRAGERWHGEVSLVRRDGGTLPVLVTVSNVLGIRGAPRAFIGSFVDISERKRQEDALAAAQKMESLGLMAGGIAHDFNNLLGAILGLGSLALRKLPDDAEARPDLEKLLQAAHRAADLTRQILAYSGRAHFEVRPLDLNALVRENLGLFEVAVPKNVALEPQLADGLPAIRADAGQLQQLVMNLLLNGAEAIGTRRGTVRVRTTARELRMGDDRRSLTSSEPVAPGSYVALEVHDDGAGMDRETMARIFDPFFTTKDTGRGLGLAAVLGIVRAHGGGLRVQTVKGLGTRFELLFPSTDEAPSLPAPEAPSSPVSGRLVLVVDDDSGMRTAVEEMLAAEGFDVAVAANGEEGLAVYAERRREVGLVILDLSMPGLSGADTFRELRRLSADLPVLLTSGYHEVEATRGLAGLGLAGFIQKPYGIDVLIAEVQRCLRPTD